MTETGASGVGRLASLAAESGRQWAPYVAATAATFAAAAVVGATSGAAEPSAFVPDGGGDAAATFRSLASVAALMVVGGVFVLLPTVALLGVQGVQFGAGMAALVGSVGVGEAVAVAGPAAAVGVPALWLVGAIPIRGLHYAARMIRDGPPPAVESERLVGESVAIAALSLLGLYLAATLATGATPT